MRSIHPHPESESEKLLHQGSHHHKASRTTSTCRAPWQYPREKSEECRAGPKARCGMRMMHETRCETSQIHIRTLSNGDCHSKQPPLAPHPPLPPAGDGGRRERRRFGVAKGVMSSTGTKADSTCDGTGARLGGRAPLDHYGGGGYVAPDLPRRDCG